MWVVGVSVPCSSRAIPATFYVFFSRRLGLHRLDTVGLVVFIVRRRAGVEGLASDSHLGSWYKQQ